MGHAACLSQVLLGWPSEESVSPCKTIPPISKEKTSVIKDMICVVKSYVRISYVGGSYAQLAKLSAGTMLWFVHGKVDVNVTKLLLCMCMCISYVVTT